jgi:hypothetical protein
MSFIGSTRVKQVRVVSQSAFASLFPGLVPGSNYAYTYHGHIRVLRAGTYKFCTDSKDGSMIWVDGARVVDNDGVHDVRTRCGTKALNTGLHDVFIAGFVKNGDGSLKAYYNGPDTREHDLQVLASILSCAACYDAA